MQRVACRPLISILGLVSLLTLHGCGEPEPGPPPAASSAEGFWTGSTNTNQTLTGVVLDDGTYYFFYSAAANPTQIAGVIQGTGTSSDSTFTSGNAKDFRIGASALDATISATYENRRFLNATITYAGGAVVTFTSTFDTTYTTNPTLAVVAGFYFGQAGSSGGVQSANITVTGSGPFAGTEANGCTFTGTATPRIRGNAFNQSIVFGGAPCFFAGSTFQGIALFTLTPPRLTAAAPNGARTDAAIFFGLRL
ncbi:MAG: hypothetical protein P0111_09260 [Nitrospira sp.]|nr:hypothetical protein [Nitrospira sp.]